MSVVYRVDTIYRDGNAGVPTTTPTGAEAEFKVRKKSGLKLDQFGGAPCAWRGGADWKFAAPATYEKVCDMRNERALVFLTTVLLLVAALFPPPSPGQVLAEDQDWASDGLGEVAFLGLNAAVGALTAGVWQELSGGSFERGFTQGALGGSVVYAGKRVAAESFPGAGFLGRELAAVGSSIVRNAADARPLLDSLSLPAGPLRLRFAPPDPTKLAVEPNLGELYWTIYGFADGRLEFDLTESLSSGMAVFQSDRFLAGTDDERINGGATAGVVFLSPLGEGQREETLAHERAHVLQIDFLHHAWFGPLERKMAEKLPYQGLSSYVDYGVLYPTIRWGGSLLGWDYKLDAPIEAEAEFLEGR